MEHGETLTDPDRENINRNLLFPVTLAELRHLINRKQIEVWDILDKQYIPKLEQFLWNVVGLGDYGLQRLAGNPEEVPASLTDFQ